MNPPTLWVGAITMLGLAMVYTLAGDDGTQFTAGAIVLLFIGTSTFIGGGRK